MDNPKFFDSKNTLNLFGLDKNFLFLSTLYEKQKLPKVSLISGIKGIGKSTLVNHFLFSIFDSKNYNKKNFSLLENSIFYKQFKNELFPNIIYIKGSDFKSVKIDDIRNLKNKIFKTTILSKDRFIIFDDIELFNLNSLNALLKIIEEPNNNNFFFLINNKAKPLLDTIKSRALEIKIIINENQRVNIINELVNFFKIDPVLSPKLSQLTPGNFLKFNHIFNEYEISISNDFIDNLAIVLDLYKKKKETVFLDIAFFITDFYLKDLRNNNIFQNDEIYEIKNFIFNNLNNFLLYNVNHNTLINTLTNKLKYE